MIKYKFFDKHCYIDRGLMNRSALEQELHKEKFNFAHINFVNQIHSNNVVVIDAPEKIHGTQNLPKADAIVANLPNLAIAVVTADCSPILMFDSKNNVIAAVHAGWRGARNGIILEAVKAMKNLGADVSQISANIGPMIHQKSYQISQEFYDDFLCESEKNKIFFSESDALNHYQFDLPAYVKRKLHEEGIENITDIAINTYTSQNHASFRRATHQGALNDVRNISLIMIEE